MGMKKLLYALVIAALSISSCSTLCAGIKLVPQYRGVDPKLQGMVDEWLWLAKQNNLVFSRKVTVGFKKIGRDRVIGLCTYGLGWHEIDIDTDIWESISGAAKLEVVFHELTHCYCNRSHDYGNGIEYPSSESARVAQALDWTRNGGERPGRLADGCPSSIMYPIALQDDCVWHHYDFYVAEMFDRCKPF